jgi:hypothetical protein
MKNFLTKQSKKSKVNSFEIKNLKRGEAKHFSKSFFKKKFKFSKIKKILKKFLEKTFVSPR